MILSNNGKVCMEGSTAEIGIDILLVLECFNKAVERGDFEMDFLKDTFELDPEVVTTFTKNFVKATHK